MRPPRHGVAYAIHLTLAHFGPLPSAVITALLRRGSLSLPDLFRFTSLSPSQLKNSLLILIQHSCVQAFSLPRSANRSVTLYMAVFDNIVHRGRFGKFLGVIKSDPEIGDVAVAAAAPNRAKKPPVPGAKKEETIYVNLVEGLLQHGRLSFEQLYLREASKPENTMRRSEIRGCFNRLVREQFVERCPKAEPFISGEGDKPASKKRGASKTFEETVTIEQQALMASAHGYAVRFSELSDIGTDSAADVKVNLPRLVIKTGDKRKHETCQAEEVQSTIADNEVLYRANFEKFIHCLKLKICSVLLRRKFGSDTAIVVEAMIESSQKDKFKDKNNVKASVESILSIARKKKGGEPMTQEDLTKFLDKIGCDFQVHETGTLCVLDLKKIIESSRKDEVEATVSKRYGEEALKILRLFSQKDKQDAPETLEIDNISDKTFIHKTLVTDILYKLWQDDYMEMEKPSQLTNIQKFYWSVNHRTLRELVLNEMYHGALNICLRTADIVKQRLEVDKLTQEKDDKLRRSQWILEYSLMKIDDALLVFKDS